MRIWIGLFMALVGLSGCEYLQFEKDTPDEEAGQPVARVYDKYLYATELQGLVPPRVNPTDSADIIGRYVDAWIKKQLMLADAEKNMDMDESELQRRILDYRYQLIVYSYEKKFVSENLDTVVTNEEIQQYYDNNKDDFELKGNILKGMMVKVPKEAPRLDEVRNWFYYPTSENVEKIKSYSYSYADFFHLNDSIWVDFDELIVNTPFMEEVANPVQTLKTKRFLESSDSSFVFYIRINDFKISDQTSPVEFVSDRIKDIIINKRKVDLRRNHERSVFEKAKENSDYEVF